MLKLLDQSLESQGYSSADDRTVYGLSSSEAGHRYDTTGANILEAKRKKGPLKIFLGQFHDIMVMILLAATVISVLLGEYTDAIPMIAVVIINSFLGFIQEYRCEKTLEHLSAMTAPTAMVYRDGKLKKIPAERVVQGDVFYVEAGDRIPADGYIITCKAFACDESVLTGETEPASKKQRTNEIGFDKLNKAYMVYMGTVVTKGTAAVEVTATGKNTQMGKVSKMLDEVTDEQTPLQKKLGELGRTLALICIFICILVFFAGLMRGEPVFDMLMTSITIAIAAIPEGLPAAVTIALALSVRKMLKRNALVNRLHSVETLGCASVICTDKTGTVTQNKMSVTKIISVDNYSYDAGKELSEKPELTDLFICGAMCSNAILEEHRPSIIRKNKDAQRFSAQGDPTECAIILACANAGITAADLPFKRVDEIPFDSGTRSMTVVCTDIQGNSILYKKGSPDVIIDECTYTLSSDGLKPFNLNDRLSAMKMNDISASEGLRVIAFSKTENGRSIYLGMMCMQDPPRPEAAKAVKLCERAGIRTVMITGDHKLTAAAIARQTGILKHGSLILTGEELDNISDEGLSDIIDNCSVFARVTPAHKLRIVKAFRSKGHICAMTGDGVNDAPAVKEADIGVSMGMQGTDVTKQAADVILLDDNFATLVNAVEEGRTIYHNIRKFVRYMISSNIGEVVTMFGGILMGLPMVLLPSQILLVNLVTDSLPAVALGLEPSDKEIMKKPPRKESDSFFSGGLLWRMLVRGILIGICTLGTFTTILGMGESLCCARTGALMTLVLSQLIHVFECRSEDKTMFSVPLFSNPFLIFAVIISSAVLFASIYMPFLQSVFFTAIPKTKPFLIALCSSFSVPLLSAFVNIFSRRSKKNMRILGREDIVV